MKKLLLYENRKQRFLNILRLGLNPFKKFVSTGEIKEDLGIIRSRKNFLDSVVELIENHENFILPIIGGVGAGKTHFFWALKEKLYYYNLIYLSLENVYRRFYYNIYSKYIEEMGVKVLRNITSQLCNEWGALERKFGFFHVADIKKVKWNGFHELYNDFEDITVLKDIINVITTHQLDPYKKIEAENWLLGELMDYKTLAMLKLNSDLKKNAYAYMMLKILMEQSKLGSVLYLDEFDTILPLINPSIGESSQIYDPSWLHGDETVNPESKTAKKILERILKLQNIKGLKIILTMKSIESFIEVKKLIQEKNHYLLSLFREPLIIPNFIEKDIIQFYKKSLKQFAKNVDYTEFNEDFPDSYFPLNERILKGIYSKSHGNPRQITKNLLKTFNEIIFSRKKLDVILKDYEEEFPL